MTDELYERIIDVIPSNSLKNKIREPGFRLTDADLLHIAFHYAPDYDTRLALLAALEKECTGELRDYTARLIEAERAMLADFQKSEPDAVFELYIKEKPDAYEERYLCATYSDALAVIPLFYQAYDGKETAAARYTIKKRSVLTAAAGFAEDGLGEVELLPGAKLASVFLCSYYHKAEGCDGKCPGCERCCVRSWDTAYPCFVGHGDAVKYDLESGAEKYGIAFSLNDKPGECIYVIPLNSDPVRFHEFENVHDAHIHVFSPFVEHIELSELPEAMRVDYEACREYILQRWPKNGEKA